MTGRTAGSPPIHPPTRQTPPSRALSSSLPSRLLSTHFNPRANRSSSSTMSPPSTWILSCAFALNPSPPAAPSRTCSRSPTSLTPASRHHPPIRTSPSPPNSSPNPPPQPPSRSSTPHPFFALTNLSASTASTTHSSTTTPTTSPPPAPPSPCATSACHSQRTNSPKRQTHNELGCLRSGVPSDRSSSLGWRSPILGPGMGQLPSPNFRTRREPANIPSACPPQRTLPPTTKLSATSIPPNSPAFATPSGIHSPPNTLTSLSPTAPRAATPPTSALSAASPTPPPIPTKLCVRSPAPTTPSRSFSRSRPTLPQTSSSSAPAACTR